MDWRLKKPYHTGKSSELCVAATRLRPLFYKKLIELGVMCDKGYSERIYQTLLSGGEKIELSPEELQQIQEVFHSISKEILSRMQAHKNI